MSDFDKTMWLAALLGHLNHHPETVITLSGIDPDQRKIQLYPHDDPTNSHLRALATWAHTLTDAQPVVVRAIDEETGWVHLHLSGHLVGGQPVRVVAITDRDESDLLAANTPLEKGATFPVELLHHLVALAPALEATS